MMFWMPWWQWLVWLWCKYVRVQPAKSQGWRQRSSNSQAGYSRAKPAWVIREVIRLKALMPRASCRVIAQTFNRLQIQRAMSVGKSFVATCVRQHQYEIESERRLIKHRVPLPVPRNWVWALDLTGKVDTLGQAHQMLGLIDHGSRALLDLARLSNKRSLTLLGHLFLAMGKYGKPKVLRTDNEAVFRSRWFRWMLKLIGVRQQFSDPGCPWQNGRIERLFGTLKASLDQVSIDTGVALDGLLMEFRFFYNHVRPHQHLSGATPAEVWRGVDWTRQRAKTVYFVRLWDGMLTGYYLRR